MTSRVLDRRDRSAQNTLIASIGAGVTLATVVAFVAFGAGGGGRADGGGIAAPVATPSAPTESPSAPPVPSATPTPTPDSTRGATDAPTPDPTDGGSDAIPIKVDLENATGADVYVDIVDRTGRLVDAKSGTPAEGTSVEPYTLKVENIDATTLKVTWVDYPIDNALALFIDESDGRIGLLLVQPEPTGPTDAMAFDRELILEFAEEISANDVETFLEDGLVTPG